jgi:hypothetical protein
MQEQFSIELRVDYADRDKIGPVKEALMQCARHLFAAAQLISDNPRSTTISVHSENWFAGKKEISLMEDFIQKGLDSVAAETDSKDAAIGQELLDAFK